MAVVGFTRAPTQGNTHRVVWANLLNTDTGAPISIPGAADYTMQVFAANFGVGGTVILEGSCEATPTNFFSLKDPQGNNLSFTAAGGELVSENVTHIRPRVSAGDGTTDITVILLMRSTMR